jgi:hypothetical protein
MRTAAATILGFLVLASGALAATPIHHFWLRADQQRTFTSAQTGDRITCRAGETSVTLVIPRRGRGAFKQTTVAPTERLAISVGHTGDGAHAFCRWP